jgi:hypothetical protein
MKLTYEQLEKSRDSWKNIAQGATMYLRVIKGGDADRNLLISEIAKLSEWNTKHIEENDKLKLEIAELETGRTMSCVFCNNTAKERDEAIKQLDEIVHAVQLFVHAENLFAAKAFSSTTTSYGDERPRAWQTALRAMAKMVGL